MQTQTSSQMRWSSKGLLELLRASLPPAGSGPGQGSREPRPVVERLNSRQLAEVAETWRARSAEGDKGAESVAQALELLARRREGEKRTRIQAMGQRISNLMMLS